VTGRQVRLCALRRGLALAIATGAIAALCPVVPVIERADVVQTQVQRVAHERRADFASGQTGGRLALVGDADSPALALTSPGEGTYTSQPVDLALAATSVAAHWTQSRAAGAAISLALRTSPDGLAWTEWREVEGEGGVAAGDGLTVFSAPAAADGARHLQYRIALASRGPELPAVRAVSLFALDSATAPLRSEVRLRLVPRGRAEATIKPLGIVSRRQWGADEGLRFEARAGQARGELWPEQVQAVEKIVVHHTAGANVCASPEVYCQRRSVIAINDVYYYHAVVNGWGDIGYNSLIGYDGRIYEGRHGAGPTDDEPLDQPVVAGHALGYNRRTHGIALMGDFQREPVPDLQYEALAKTVGWIVKSRLAAGGRIDPLGSSAYALSDGRVRPGLPNIVGHRDVSKTECPGDYLYARLANLRDRAKRLIEWPPVYVELRARPGGDSVAYHIMVDNHEPDLARHFTVKGAVPANAEFVDSWAGSPYRNRGVFDGSVVTWYDPDGTLAPGLDRREYVFVVRPRPGVPRADVKTVAWVQFDEPAPGVAMSEAVSADQPVEAIADPAAGGRATWRGDWPTSRNVPDYYGDAYQVHAAGDGSAAYTWEADLFEPGAYEVFAWWTEAADRASNAPYVVFARDGAHVVRASQRERGSQWVSLGTYAFAAGPARVVLSDGADGVVIADAIRFLKRPLRP